MRLFLDVGHLVVVEIRRGCESFPTHSALMGLFPTVDPPVGVQGGARRESFPADLADVGFFSGVRSHVPLQERRAVESFPALAAG